MKKSLILLLISGLASATGQSGSFLGSMCRCMLPWRSATEVVNIESRFKTVNISYSKGDRRYVYQTKEHCKTSIDDFISITGIMLFLEKDPSLVMEFKHNGQTITSGELRRGWEFLGLISTKKIGDFKGDTIDITVESKYPLYVSQFLINSGRIKIERNS